MTDLLQPAYEDVQWSWGPAEVRRYALAVGAPRSPLDDDDLRLVTSDKPQVLPMFAMLLADAHSLRYVPLRGVDYRQDDVIYAGHELELSRPLRPTESGTTRSKVLEIRDIRSGILVRRESVSFDAAGDLLARNIVTSVIRGATSGRIEPSSSEAVTQEDASFAKEVEIQTLPQQALLYLQTGDDDPLHWDPSTARAAGFDRPILHGLCTAAMVVHAVIGEANEYGADDMLRLSVRFTSPVLPGDTIRAHMSGTRPVLRFEALVDGRRVLDAGVLQMRERSM